MRASYYYDAVMLDNPVVFYPLDEETSNNGDIAYDIASSLESARNATYHGYAASDLPLVSGGEHGTVINYNNYLSIPPLEKWSMSRETNPFSFECWIRVTEDNQDGIRLLQPYSQYGAIPDNYIAIEDGQIIFKVANGGDYWSTDLFTVAKHDLLEPMMSHHLVFTYSNNILKIYVDSRLVDTIKVPFRVKWNFNTTEFRVFNRNTTSYIVDAIAFYKGDLSTAAIQRHYLTGRSTIGSQEIARRTKGNFFPIDDIDSKAVLDIDWPQNGKWPVAERTTNVTNQGTAIGLAAWTSPDTVDDNIFFSNGAFQLLPGSKLLSDDMSTFNNGLNLLENASFDVDSDGNGLPDLWVVANNSGGTVGLSSDAVSSQNSLVMTMAGASVGTYIRVSNTNKTHIGELVTPGEPFGDLPLPVPSPKPYTQTDSKPTQMVFSFDAKGAITNGLLNVRIKQWNEATALTDMVIPVNVDVLWGRKQVPFTLFSNATDVLAYIEILAGNSCTAQVYADNAMLEFGNVFNQYVDGWFKYSDTGTFPLMSRSEIYDSGNSSLKLECSSALSSSIGVVSERLPVDAGDLIYVRLSAYSPSVVTNSAVDVWYHWYNQAGTIIGSPVKYSSYVTQEGWIPVWALDEAPADAETLQVYVTFSAPAALGIGTEVLFDNIYINEIADEAAQYMVVEEFSSISNLGEGSYDLEFYLSSIHQDTKKTYVVSSLDDSTNAIQIVKKYDSLSSAHKVVMRHIYTLSGVPQIHDTDIVTLTSGDYDQWYRISVGWVGDEFYAALNSSNWDVVYDTSTFDTLQLTSSFDLTLGAGIDGLDSLGTAIKNVNIYQGKVTPQTEQEFINYQLPLQDDVNIRMTGYAEFWFDFTIMYESVDDAKIEWGPNNSRIKVYGGTSRPPGIPLENCTEPLPIKGGYCPSTVAQKYNVRVVFSTDDTIYKPAVLSYMSLTFLDDVKFKSRGANHVIKPTGSFTVATRSTPIINQFYKNGVSFTKTTSKNLLINGGFNYDTSGWLPSSDAMCKIERSVDEYVSGGASLKVTAMREAAGFTNRFTGPSNRLPILINDIGSQGFDNYQNCEVMTTGEVKLLSGLPVQKIKKNASGDVSFGSSTTNKIAGYNNVGYNISLDVYRLLSKTVSLVVDRYDPDSMLLGTVTHTVLCDAVNAWQNVSIDMPPLANEAYIVINVVASNANGWTSGDAFYLSNIKIEQGNGSSQYEFSPGLSDSDVKLTTCNVSANTTYTASAKFISDVGTANAKIVVDSIDSAFNKLSTYTTSVSQINESTWTTVSGTFTTPANTKYLSVTPYITNVQNGFVAYVDEIQVEPGGSVSAYEDNVPSGMYLDLFSQTPVQTDDGYMGTTSRQQKVGSIEQWIKPTGGDGTILENVYTDGTKCGVYYGASGITSQNMSAVFLNGEIVSTDNKFMNVNNWNHIVAIPQNKVVVRNYVTNPSVASISNWSAASTVTLGSPLMDSPGGDRALSMMWEGPPSTPGAGAFSAETNCAVTESTYYTVSFYINSAVARNVEINIDWKNGSTIVKSSRSIIENTSTGKWVRRYATFVAPGGIDNADVSIGVSAGTLFETHYISAIMVTDEPYLTAYFDGDTSIWEGPQDDSTSAMSIAWPSRGGPFSRWYWNTSFDGTGQMNASYSNITLHEEQLSSGQVYDNYISTLSRGKSLSIEDVMSTKKYSTPAIDVSDSNNLSIRSGNVSAWSGVDPALVLSEISRLNLNTVTIPVLVSQAAAASNSVAIDNTSLAFAHTIISLLPSWINYIIEPYPWIDNGNIAETSLNPSDKSLWFASWQAALTQLANEFPNSWGLYVASNLILIESETARWSALMDYMRTVYTHNIIYRTNWWATAVWDTGPGSTTEAYNNKLNNSLFSKPDIIAISGYFELMDIANPTQSQLLAALDATTVFGRQQNVYQEVVQLAEKWNKPLFIGEIGIPSVDYATLNPWNPTVSTTYNDVIQRNALSAYVEKFSNHPLFLGLSLLTIGHPSPTNYTLNALAGDYFSTLKVFSSSNIRYTTPPENDTSKITDGYPIVISVPWRVSTGSA